MSVCWSWHPKRLYFARPLHHARGPIAHRDVMILRARDSDGVTGFGELCPWPEFGSCATPTSEGPALSPGDVFSEAGETSLPSEALDSVEAIRSMIADVSAGPEVRAAIELAALDLLARRTQTTVARLLESNALDCVPIHHLVNDETDTPLLAHAVKIKVGGDLDSDLSRVQEVRKRLGPSVPIRLDANGAWTPKIARAAIDRLAPHGIEFIEQPVPAGDARALAALRGVIPIAADEGVRDSGHLHALLDADAVDVVVLKPAFLGGLLATQRLAEQAQKAGVATIITHALGSTVERTGALHLAAALRTTRACGLSHPYPVDIGELYVIASGLAHLGHAPGLGLTVDGRDSKAITI